MRRRPHGRPIPSSRAVCTSCGLPAHGLRGPGSHLVYAPITTAALRLWADARRAGVPTAGPRSLDADAILAAQAVLACGPADTVTVATTNVGHLTRFVDARPWDQIVP